MTVNLNPLKKYPITWTNAQHLFWRLRSKAELADPNIGQKVFQGGIDRDVPEDVQLLAPCSGETYNPYPGPWYGIAHESGWKYIQGDGIKSGRKPGIHIETGEGFTRAGRKNVHEHGESPAGKRVSAATALKKMAAYEKKHGHK